MKITFIFIFTIFLFFYNPNCYTQTEVRLSKSHLELKDNNINIYYDILNSRQTDKFRIWVEITDSTGIKVDTRSLGSDIGYWLPSDAQQNSKAAWFGDSRLVDYLKAVKSKHTLLIADACFGGAIFKTRTAFPDARKAIQKLYELTSRKAMTSGTLTEVPDRSTFINFLVKGLRIIQKNICHQSNCSAVFGSRL